MKKFVITLAILASLGSAKAQKTSEVLEKIQNNVDINLLLRSSLEFTDVERKQNGFRQNEARFQVTGKINDRLDYNVRIRLHKSQIPKTLDNAPASLDYASLSYTLGENRDWRVTVGKQANNFGNWEFEKNPTFEYLYSDLIKTQTNLFTVGAKLAHQINDNHTVEVLVYNAKNDTFDSLHPESDFNENNLTASELPLATNLAWRGNFADKKFRTFYSVGASQIAEGKTDFQLAMGNKLVLDRFEAYLDLQHTHIAVDYADMISSTINEYRRTMNPNHINIYAQKLESQTAVLRLDYAITPKWYITAKSVYERLNDRGVNSLGNSLSQHHLNLIGIEYKPFASQNFRFFGYYANDYKHYNNALHKVVNKMNINIFAIGALYNLNAF